MRCDRLYMHKWLENTFELVFFIVRGFPSVETYRPEREMMIKLMDGMKKKIRKYAGEKIVLFLLVAEAY